MKPEADPAQTGSTARELMAAFSRRSGVVGTAPPRRYLWTDAFAVCNFLALHRQTGDDSDLDTARQLVDQVHAALGHFSGADPRSGWISGLDEETGQAHPTAGGLRIGKQLLERQADEPIDERLEWDRDGQYFHYLTKWMHALNRMAAATGNGRFQRWALELARASHAGFTYTVRAGQPKRMYWKMSVDLSRPLVSNMGHHDPLDALITYLQLEVARVRYGSSAGDISLEDEIADCRAMCAGRRWATDDPLGTGGLLANAFRLAQLMPVPIVAGAVDLPSLLADCEVGLQAFAHSGTLDWGAEYRLAFRELGLSIGLHSLERMRRLVEVQPDRFPSSRQLPDLLARLGGYHQLTRKIEHFWLQPQHQQSATWRDHEDINSVMLATSLAPDGYLLLDSGA